jgi:hypothetical protein
MKRASDFFLEAPLLVLKAISSTYEDPTGPKNEGNPNEMDQ